MSDKKESARLRKAASNARLKADGYILKAFRIKESNLPRYKRFHADIESEANTQED
jgi:hypothetical protein